MMEQKTRYNDVDGNSDSADSDTDSDEKIALRWRYHRYFAVLKQSSYAAHSYIMQNSPIWISYSGCKFVKNENFLHYLI